MLSVDCRIIFLVYEWLLFGQLCIFHKSFCYNVKRDATLALCSAVSGLVYVKMKNCPSYLYR